MSAGRQLEEILAWRFMSEMWRRWSKTWLVQAVPAPQKWRCVKA